MNKRRLQQVDIPFKEEVNKDEEDFNDLKKKGSWNIRFRGRDVRNNTRGGWGQQTFTFREREGNYNNHDKRNIQCYSCNQFEHYNTECRKKASLEVHEQKIVKRNRDKAIEHAL
jgi:hypothetical protein